MFDDEFASRFDQETRFDQASLTDFSSECTMCSSGLRKRTDAALKGAEGGTQAGQKGRED